MTRAPSRYDMAREALPLLRKAIALLDEAECRDPAQSSRSLTGAYLAACTARKHVTAFLRLDGRPAVTP